MIYVLSDQKNIFFITHTLKISFLTPVQKDETDEIQTDRCFFLAGQKVKSEVSHRTETAHFLTRGQLHVYYFLRLVIVNNNFNLNFAEAFRSVSSSLQASESFQRMVYEKHSE